MRTTSNMSLRDRRAAGRLSEACRKRGMSYRATETADENWRVEVYPTTNQGRASERVEPLFSVTSEYLYRAYDLAAEKLPPSPEGAPIANQHAKGWHAKREARRAAELAEAWR